MAAASTTELSAKTTVVKAVSHVDSVRFATSSPTLVVALSKLTGNTWNGGIYVVEGDIRKKWETTAGNADAVWIGDRDESIVAAGDDSTLRVYSAINAKTEEPIAAVNEHHDIVSSLSTSSKSKHHVLSGSWDSTIKLWDFQNNTNAATNTFIGHFDVIWNVEWQPGSADIFASTSQDKTVRVWDKRVKEHSGCVQSLAFTAPVFSLSWKRSASGADSPVLAIGNENGDVNVIDTRKANEPLAAFPQLHKLGVYRLAFSPSGYHNGELLASGGDDGHVRVTSLAAAEKKAAYDYAHKDFVRGLSWYHGANRAELASGAWDKTIVLHSFA